MNTVDKKLLLHICCAPCSTHVVEKLSEDYAVMGYFYNPNLYPQEEFETRCREAKKYFKDINKEIYIEKNYDKKLWLNFVSSLEQEPEGGARCVKCYRLRLEKTAQKAKELGIKYFTTTLTISPYKKASIINPIGTEIAKKYKLNFISEDFKKEDGFKRSIDMSHQHDLYRQSYCGCEFSIRD